MNEGNFYSNDSKEEKFVKWSFIFLNRGAIKRNRVGTDSHHADNISLTGDRRFYMLSQGEKQEPFSYF